VLIWGSRSVRRTVDSGKFYCPECSSSQYYRLIRARRFGHVYWIPLLPLGDSVEYVECETCRGTYKPGVLDMKAPPSQGELAGMYHEGVRRVLISVLSADGRIDPSELHTVSQIYESLTKRSLSPAEIQAEIRAGDTSSLNAYLTDLEPFLNNPGKEIIIKAALMVAAADGDFDPREKTEIFQIARALSVSQAHLSGIISELSETRRSGAPA
jgi:uncharacterized tellurite resistance protein B-like protein